MILALLLTTAGTALAGPEAATPIRQAALSAELYADGVAQGDALLIVAAASLRKSAEIAIEPAAALSWQSMLDRARGMAGDDAALLGLIEDVAAESAKGVLTGPIYRLAELPPGEVALPMLEFKGGEKAEVYVEAAPGTDLNLTIRDAEGRVVCADSHPSSIVYCNWTPAQDGAFTVTLENRSDTATDYALMTN
jgi:hypothetical protein